MQESTPPQAQPVLQPLDECVNVSTRPQAVSQPWSQVWARLEQMGLDRLHRLVAWKLPHVVRPCTVLKTLDYNSTTSWKGFSRILNEFLAGTLELWYEEPIGYSETAREIIRGLVVMLRGTMRGLVEYMMGGQTYSLRLTLRHAIALLRKSFNSLHGSLISLRLFTWIRLAWTPLPQQIPAMEGLPSGLLFLPPS